MAFLELRTPRDMLDKVKREHGRLSSDFNIDNVFNFFVTANHIRDYIEKSAAVDRNVIATFCSSQDMLDCRDLCDKPKHLRLTKRTDPITHRWSGALGGAPLNVLPLGGDGRWELWSDNRHVDIQQLAGRVLDSWDRFFDQYGL
jgi:hypothetical protein